MRVSKMFYEKYQRSMFLNESLCSTHTSSRSDSVFALKLMIAHPQAPSNLSAALIIRGAIYGNGCRDTAVETHSVEGTLQLYKWDEAHHRTCLLIREALSAIKVSKDLKTVHGCNFKRYLLGEVVRWYYRLDQRTVFLLSGDEFRRLE